MDNKKTSIATFAGGCFWCMQPPYHNKVGVEKTIVGYIGGNHPNPTYEEVCTGRTNHTEAMEIYFNSHQISYLELLTVFWENIDPTQYHRQFADIGSQYRTGIFYHNDEQKKIAEKSKLDLENSGKHPNPIVTEISPATIFYPAENYHQNYHQKNPLHYNNYKKNSGREDYLKTQKS